MLKKRKGAVLSFDSVSYLVALIIFVTLGTYGWHVYMDNAKRSTAKNQIATITAAVSHYHYDMEAYPASLDALSQKSGAYGPWIGSVPKDPWGNDYQYTVNSDKTRFVIFSTAGGSGTVNAEKIYTQRETQAVFAYGQ
ncbi:type II secretion system protein GspG [Selenomonas ruminantium]|uniref:type II secretion system protein GspG n=1 Tax=Selenomonas ruminantium TaxID=971 RepID=UPI0026F0FF84|nr:type II secretion system protein GspG [Selenomonas ruminantium]